MSKIQIATNLKRLREQIGLTADEVGIKIGKSGKTVNAWENGRPLQANPNFFIIGFAFGIIINIKNI